MTKTVSDQVADRMIRHLLNLERFKNHETAKITRMMRDQVVPGLTERLERRLKWIATRGVDKGVHSTQRLKDLVKFSKDYVKSGARRLYNEVAGDMKALAVQEAEFSVDVLKASVPKQVPFEFVRPPTNLLRSIVNSQPMQGRIMRDWFDTIASNTQGEIVRQLNIGIAGGETIPQMSRRMREATGMMSRQATTVVRTATNHVSNHARDAAYKANDDVVKGWKYVATLDTRTTPICMAEDGKVYGLDEGRKPPLHYNCRSSTVPVLKSWEELGIDAKELPPSTRASMGGQVPATQTYGKWLKGQEAWVQNEALGKKRAALFRQGKVTVKQLVKRNGKPLTLEQLRAKGKKITGAKPKPKKAPAVPKPKTADQMLKGLKYKELQALEAKNVKAREHLLSGGERSAKEHEAYWSQKHVLDASRKEFEAKLGKAIELPQAARADGLDVTFSTAVTKAKRATVNKGVEWVKSVVSKNAMPDGRIPKVTIKKQIKSKPRSWYQPWDKTVKYTENAMRITNKVAQKVSSTVPHELGHHLEHSVPGMTRKIADFILRRAKEAGSKVARLRDVVKGSGYKVNEICLEDKFKNPYSGRLYYDWKGSRGKVKIGTSPDALDPDKFDSSEVLSMGVQHLYEDPVGFLRDDPEFFKFVVNLLRGHA